MAFLSILTTIITFGLKIGQLKTTKQLTDETQPSVVEESTSEKVSIINAWTKLISIVSIWLFLLLDGVIEPIIKTAFGIQLDFTGAWDLIKIIVPLILK